MLVRKFCLHSQTSCSKCTLSFVVLKRSSFPNVKIHVLVSLKSKTTSYMFVSLSTKREKPLSNNLTLAKCEDCVNKILEDSVSYDSKVHGFLISTSASPAASPSFPSSLVKV